MVSPTASLRRLIPSRSRRAALLAVLLFGSIFSYLLISRLILDLVVVSGASMNPGLHHGDRFLLHRYLYMFRDPAPGDIVAVRDPADEDLSVKRIVAGPGDAISISNGLVTVNGERLVEPYIREQGVTYTLSGTPYAATLEPGYYFILGDNRRNSIDARVYGPVERDRILGKIRSP